MSLAWSAHSDEVARGIAVLQRSAAHDAEVWDRAITVAKAVAEKCSPIGEWVLIGEVTSKAHVSESLASSAVWRLCDEGVLKQDFETSDLSVAH